MVSLLERCPHFRGVLREGFRRTHSLWHILEELLWDLRQDPHSRRLGFSSRTNRENYLCLFYLQHLLVCEREEGGRGGRESGVKKMIVAAE